MAVVNETELYALENCSITITTNKTAVDPFVGVEIGPVTRAFFIAIGCVEVLSGTVGSCLLLTVLLTSCSLGMRSFHYLFIANLALADLLSMGYWMSFFVLDLILGYHPVVNNAHCVANGFLICMSTAVSVLSLTFISMNRYLHVCQSHLYSRVFTKRRTIVCCLVLWILSAVMAGPPLFGVGEYYYKVTVHVCTFSEKRGAMYSNTISTIVTLGSSLLIGYFNLAIFLFWKRSRLKLKPDFLASAQRSHRWSCGCLRFGGSVQGHTLQIMELEGSNDLDTEETTCRKETELSTYAPQEATENSNVSNQDTEARGDEEGGENRNKHRQEERLRDDCISEIPPEHSTHSLQTIKPSNEMSGIKKTSSHMKQLNRRRRKQEARDQAFVRSLFVVFLLSLISFTPFAVLRVFESHQKISSEVDITGVLLLFSNNAVNWIVYGVMNRSFRRGYVKLVTRILGKCW